MLNCHSTADPDSRLHTGTKHSVCTSSKGNLALPGAPSTCTLGCHVVVGAKQSLRSTTVTRPALNFSLGRLRTKARLDAL